MKTDQIKFDQIKFNQIETKLNLVSFLYFLHSEHRF